MRARCAVALALAAALAAGGACSGGDGDEAGPAAGDAVLLAVDGRGVTAYSLRAGAGEQLVVDDPVDASGSPAATRSVCVVPDGSRRFLVAERVAPGDGDLPGWALYQLAGDGVGRFSAERLHRLVPSHSAGGAAAVPTGCAFMSDGRLLTTDFGAPGIPGRLVVWFPPFDLAPVRSCTVDRDIAAAQAVLLGRSDAVFVASAAAPTAGVLRYGADFPTGPDEAGGCGDDLAPDLFLPPDERLPAADALAAAPGGGLFVASALAGRVTQYDRLGRFVRTVLAPPHGEREAGEPLPTGTPVALATGPAGDLLFADAALVDVGGALRALPRQGSVRRIAFRSEAPQAGEVLAGELDRPAGLAVLLLPG